MRFILETWLYFYWWHAYMTDLGMKKMVAIFFRATLARAFPRKKNFTPDWQRCWWVLRISSIYVSVCLCICLSLAPSICPKWPYYYSKLCGSQWVNSLWPSDAIWQHRSGSTLAQVMACCLMAPSHYLNQFWSLVTYCGIHLRAVSQEILKIPIMDMSLKITNLTHWGRVTHIFRSII